MIKINPKSFSYKKGTFGVGQGSSSMSEKGQFSYLGLDINMWKLF